MNPPHLTFIFSPKEKEASTAGLSCVTTHDKRKGPAQGFARKRRASGAKSQYYLLDPLV